MRVGNGSFPVQVENKPSIRLTKLNSVAMETSDKVITWIPGSSKGTATDYPVAGRDPTAVDDAPAHACTDLFWCEPNGSGGKLDVGETVEARGSFPESIRPAQLTPDPLDRHV